MMGWNKRVRRLEFGVGSRTKGRRKWGSLFSFYGLSHSLLRTPNSEFPTLITLIIFILCTFVFASPGSAAEQKPPVYVITIAGSINPPVAEFINRSILKSETDKAAAIVIQLDTPGGLDSSMRSIVQGILNAKIPVIVYVSPSGAGRLRLGW